VESDRGIESETHSFGKNRGLVSMIEDNLRIRVGRQNLRVSKEAITGAIIANSLRKSRGICEPACSSYSQ
jgi:hypothetical protein